MPLRNTWPPAQSYVTTARNAACECVQMTRSGPPRVCKRFPCSDCFRRARAALRARGATAPLQSSEFGGVAAGHQGYVGHVSAYDLLSRTRTERPGPHTDHRLRPRTVSSGRLRPPIPLQDKGTRGPTAIPKLPMRVRFSSPAPRLKAQIRSLILTMAALIPAVVVDLRVRASLSV